MFQGTHLDWLRFWNQFETEITQVAKFSYLKELLNIPKICSVADGLPAIQRDMNTSKPSCKPSTEG